MVFQSLLYNYSVVFVVIAMDGMDKWAEVLYDFNHDMDPGKSHRRLKVKFAWGIHFYNQTFNLETTNCFGHKQFSMANA